MILQILSLSTGHAILFSPNGLCVKSSDEKDESRVSTLGQGYLTVRSRLRVTRDGGHSLLAVQDAQHATRLGRVHAVAPTASVPPLPPKPVSTPAAVAAPAATMPKDTAKNVSGSVDGAVHLPADTSSTKAVWVPTTSLSLAPIVRLLAQAHSTGYPRVAFTYLQRQVQNTIYSKVELRSIIVPAVARGQVVDLGAGLYALPSDSPHRLPEKAPAVSATGPGGSEFARLLHYLRGRPPVSRKAVREHFMCEVPDAPYGAKMGQIDSVVARAATAGLVTVTGTKKTTKISLK
jgi:hypothetical protein